ncbi:MAG: peptide chain release factor N(5)-glutamine methyltransferase [Anaerolineae bacterium]|nr:peptide chain release factor N(5)-glutamine methyltransferase [Anaerolineae bacterium]
MAAETLGDWLKGAARQYATISETPAIEVEALAAAALGVKRAWVAAHHDEPLAHAISSKLNGLHEQLMNGVPLPYLTGKQEFYGLDFFVNPCVLIPRPETETLVEEALAWLRRQRQSIAGLDLCTGSGCAAVAICANHDDIDMIASDISAEALAVAKENIKQHKLQDRIELVQADLATPIRGSFQLIITNPPYIPSARLGNLAVARHEPLLALDGGETGLDMIGRIIAGAAGMLGTPGLLLCEIDDTHEQAALTLARQHFPNAKCSIIHDLAHKPRALRVEIPGESHG